MEETKVINHGVTVVDGSGPPYPPPYAPPPGVYTQPGPTVVQAVPIVMVQHPMGPKPNRVTCKSCNCEVLSRVESKAATKTHLFAALMCMLGCWCCCCIPYCMDSCMNADHYCPNCNSYLGSYTS